MTTGQPLALAVGQVGQVEVGREPDPVAHGDPDVLDEPHAVGRMEQALVRHGRP